MQNKNDTFPQNDTSVGDSCIDQYSQ